MFEFTSSLFFWTLINFVILLFLVNKFALPAFYNMVEESANKKAQAMNELESNRKNAALLMAEYEEKLSKIKDEASEILSQARREKEEMKKNELARLLQEKQDILSGIREELRHEKKRFIQDMKENAADLIVTTTGKLLRKELSATAHEELIRQNIEEFEAVLK